MRVIQNAALFGLITGTGLLFYGMVEGWLAISLLGAGLGLVIGVPAAFLNFALQGMGVFKNNGVVRKIREAVRERDEQSEATPSSRQDTAKRVTPFYTPDEKVTDVPVVVGSKAVEPEVIRPTRIMDAPPPAPIANIRPEPATDEAIAIPVRVIPPETPENQAEAILAEVLPDSEPEPQEIGLSDNERRNIIEQIEAATNDDLDLLLELAIHTDTLVRLYAVQKLGILGDPSVETALTEAYMEDAEMIVRRAARLSLNRLGLEIPVVHTPVDENASELAANE